MKNSLPEFCFETLAAKIDLHRVSGFEDIENIKLLSGEEGGGIKIFNGKKTKRVNLVEFKFEKGIPLPHLDNKPSIGAEIFQISPDLSYKIPIWGINSIIMKDGTYYFDTDFSFGFDLVMDYEFTMKYLEPFNEVYKKFSCHPDFKLVPLHDTTTWVRTYISPVFITVITTVNKIQSVYDLAGELINLWVKIYKDANEKDEALKERRQKRITAQYAGMKDTDRMGKILLGAYGNETFAKFFKAMTS